MGNGLLKMADELRWTERENYCTYEKVSLRHASKRYIKFSKPFEWDASRSFVPKMSVKQR